MKTELEEQSKTILKKHEGLKLKPYRCSAGKLTIGYGRNLDDRGINETEAELMLERDIDIAVTDSKTLFADIWKKLSDNRRMVLIDMMFNLGFEKLSGFRNFRAALKADDYEKAAFEMEKSLWYRQVGKRAIRLSKIMKNGEIEND